MGRKAGNVNRKSAERVTFLLRSLGVTQESFAEKVGYSRQSINAIACGKRRLTVDAAERFCQCYPEIREEWLLGYDDYMTREDKNAADSKFYEGYSILAQAFKGIAGYNGYKFSSDKIEGTGNIVAVPEGMEDMPIVKISCHGKEIGRCSPKEYNQMIIEISDFVDFKIKRLSERTTE